MKKFLGIVVLGLLWSGSVFSEIIKMTNCKAINYNSGHQTDYTIDTLNKTIEWTWYGKNNGKKQVKLLESQNDSYISQVYDHQTAYGISFQAKLYPSESKVKFLKFKKGKASGDPSYNDKICEFSSLANKQKIKNTKDAIMFTIKDKREQCEAIGFKPKTEKFADCVLRLVELDIKKQQDNKIAAAQNSGNMQIANQLLQMRNDNNAQYLIDLGQQLLTPQSFNSNIYLPQTQNCTIMGFDSFAKMTCN